MSSPLGHPRDSRRPRRRRMGLLCVLSFLSLGVALLPAVSWTSSPSAVSQAAAGPPGSIEGDRAKRATFDVGFELSQVVERDNIEGACERHVARLDPDTEQLQQRFRDDPVAIRDRLRCGKYLFFYSGMSVGSAMPTIAVKGMLEAFPEHLGPAFAKLGAIEDPFDPGMPIGLPPSGRLQVDGGPAVPPYLSDYRTISCAFCHFGKLADGRYAVGMPNERLELGRFTALMFYAIWLLDERKHDEDAWAEPLRRLYQTGALVILSGRLPPFLGAGELALKVAATPVPGLLEQEAYLAELPGVANVLSTILGGNKTLFVAAPGIWNISGRTSDADTGPKFTAFMPARTLEAMLHDALIIQTTSDEFSTPKYVDPLAEYVRSLEAPAPLHPPADPALVAEGQRVFERKCTECHGSSAGDSSRVIAPADIGLSDAYNAPLAVDYVPANWLSSATLRLLEKAQSQRGDPIPERYEGVRTRRLRGVGRRTRLMSNGAVEGLAHALCIGRLRKDTDRHKPFSDAVHGDLCSNYTIDERKALFAYLERF